jgi:hypothetical protein
MLSTLSVASMAIAGASAFMIPPNMALASDATVAIPSMVQDPFSTKLFAPCKGCPYAQFNGKDLVWTEGVDSSLYFNVAVNNKLDTLELNGVQIFPPPPPTELQIDPVTPRIAQLPSTVNLKDVQKNPEKYLAHALRATSWGMQATTVHSLKETGEEIIKIQLTIDSLENKPINMPNLVITALKNKEVHLMVLNVELQKASVVGQCHGIPVLCRLKQIFANSVSAMRTKLKPCHKPLPHHVSAAEQHKEDEVTKPNHPHHHGSATRPHHGGHKAHGHGHHRHHRHSVIHTIARILLTVAIPLMLGILAGMLTYTFGMLLGTFIGFLWTRFRGNRDQYQPISLPEEDMTPRTSFEERKYYDHEDVETLPIYVEVEATEAGSQV